MKRLSRLIGTILLAFFFVLPAAVAPEETLSGLNAISAPIFDLENRFVATITIAGSLQDIPPEPSAPLCVAVAQAARAISIDLGCTEYPT